MVQLSHPGMTTGKTIALPIQTLVGKVMSLLFNLSRFVITSWQIDGETMETVTDFLFLCSKITEDGDCSHEIKRSLLLGRKAMTNLDSVFREGNGNPLQYSCLENLMEGRAW